MQLAGKVALITGANLGIGRSAAVVMAQEGAQVVLNDVDEGHSAQGAEETRFAGIEALRVKADVTVRREVEVMVAQAIERFGRIDILINSAGSRLDTSPFIEEISLQDWRRVVHQCLTTPFLCCQRVVPHMQTRGYGRIVNLSPMARVSGNPLLESCSYSAARAGVSALTRQLALELGPAGITVNAIVEDDLVCDSAIHSVAAAEEIASIIVFLSSDDASYITGETVHCKSGLLRADRMTAD